MAPKATHRGTPYSVRLSLEAQKFYEQYKKSLPKDLKNSNGKSIDFILFQFGSSRFDELNKATQKVFEKFRKSFETATKHNNRLNNSLQGTKCNQNTKP